MGTPCRRDCAFYSTYTETCDFTLLNYRARPCPASNCTEYKPRGERRSWQIYTDPVRTGKLPVSVQAGEGRVRRKSPSDGRFQTADCGHEVFSGERMFANENGRRLCPDCVDLVFDRLLTAEKAYLLGYELSEAVE